MKVFIATLGCKVNQCDSASIAELLVKDGHEIVAVPEIADAAVINTCVVTARTEAQSRQLVRRALKASKRSRVVVTGCYVQHAPEVLLSLSSRVFVIGNAEKYSVPLYLRRFRHGDAARGMVTDIAARKTFATPASTNFLGRTRAYLKVQDGCNGVCTYCIVPSVRGPSRSLEPSEVRERLHGLVSSGYREIVLTGIHLGAYGLDLPYPADIVTLVKTCEEDSGCASCRIRISSIEPGEISEELISLLARARGICPHLHIPLQSGDAAVLKKMGRSYTPGFFADLMQTLTERVPGINIGVDVIVGFPGEDDSRFYNTVRFLEAIPAGYLHVFPFSRRPGTPASRLPEQVPAAVIKTRVAALRELSSRKRKQFYTAHQDRMLRVLVESRRDRSSGFLKGFSRNYIPVAADGPDTLIGREVVVRVTDARADTVRGEIVKNIA